MTDALKEIVKKPEAEWTEEDKSAVKVAVDAFAAEIDEVCKKHGLAYKAILNATEDALRPSLKVVAIETEA